jgi:fructuronate reductase/mannitol 2-dehydrogenase
VTAYAGLRDERLAAWIDRNAAFPSTMVDRITPKTTVLDRGFVAAEYGLVDRWPVITEPYSEWIVEDRFCNERPPLEDVGVRFVSDVTPYALMKTRLLNASHCAIGYLGALAGIRRADEFVRDPLFRAYVTQLMDEEVTPLLPPVPGVELGHYKRTLLERLSNPNIGDDVERLCRNGSTKVPAHVLPSIAQARRRGSEDRLLTLAVAAWFRYLRVAGERVEDQHSARMRALASAGGTDPRPLLAERDIFGDLADDRGFVADLEAAAIALERDGTRAAVHACVTAEGRLAA